MNGKIIKGIAGFYYVDVVESGVYECKAKGAVAKPDPHFHLLDRFLVMMEKAEIPVVLCFNKEDLGTEEQIQNLQEIYRDCGCRLVFSSAREEKNIAGIRKLLEGKTTVIAGPSGVGKSSLINRLTPEANMETGAISKKIERGRHTTRHAELFSLGDHSYIMDTPGFSSLYVTDIEKEELKYYFPEFAPYEGRCRFQGCDHIHEPDCAVKQAAEEGKIHPSRYQNYVAFYEELKGQRRY